MVCPIPPNLSVAMATWGGRPTIIRKGIDSKVPPPTMVPKVLAKMPTIKTEMKVVNRIILLS